MTEYYKFNELSFVNKIKWFFGKRIKKLTVNQLVLDVLRNRPEIVTNNIMWKKK